MSKELAEKMKSKDKNYQVSMTVRIHANSPQHALMKVKSPFMDVVSATVMRSDTEL